MSAVERKYQLTRITAGDYLLPSNDARTLWRIASYGEDGSLSSYDRATGRERVIRGTFWQAAHWRTGMPTDADLQREDFLDWSNWTEVECLLPTRAEAIKAALS